MKTAMILEILASIFIIWLIFNFLAPLSLIRTATPMGIGRIPADILYRANAHKVRYYVDDLRALNANGFAFSTWLVFRHAVVLDRNFLLHAPPEVIRFVLAHELGHCALGHLRQRYFLTVTGLILFPAIRRWLATKEHEADAWAEKLSCVHRSILRGST